DFWWKLAQVHKAEIQFCCSTKSRIFYFLQGEFIERWAFFLRGNKAGQEQAEDEGEKRTHGFYTCKTDGIDTVPTEKCFFEGIRIVYIFDATHSLSSFPLCIRAFVSLC